MHAGMHAGMQACMQAGRQAGMQACILAGLRRHQSAGYPQQRECMDVHYVHPIAIELREANVSICKYLCSYVDIFAAHMCEYLTPKCGPPRPVLE